MNIQRICKRIFLEYGAEVLTSGRAVSEIQPCISLLMTFSESLITNDSNEDVPVPKKQPMWILYPATSDLSGGESSPRKVSYRESYRKSIRIPAAGGWYPALWEAGCTCDPGVEKKKGAQFAGDRKQNIILISFGDLRIHRSHQLWKSAIFI